MLLRVRVRQYRYDDMNAICLRFQEAGLTETCRVNPEAIYTEIRHILTDGELSEYMNSVNRIRDKFQCELSVDILSGDKLGKEKFPS